MKKSKAVRKPNNVTLAERHARITAALELVEGLGVTVGEFNTNTFHVYVPCAGQYKVGGMFRFAPLELFNTSEEKCRIDLDYYQKRCALLDANLSYYLDKEMEPRGE